VERSTVVLEREEHRLVHEGDWRRWGSRGGRETLRRYGPRWFALLARRRWGLLISPKRCRRGPPTPCSTIMLGNS
jgi:hypothetical protein